MSADKSGKIALAEISYSPGRAQTAVLLLSAEDGTSVLAGGQPKPAPDNIPARDAWLLEPTAIAMNAAGELLIAESGACLIRKIGAQGLLTTVAGTGKCSPALATNPAKGPDLPPLASIAVDSRGRIYVADGTANFYRIADGAITPLDVPPGLGGGKLAIDGKDRLHTLDMFSMKRVSDNGELEWIVRLPSQPGVPPPGFGPTSLGNLGVDSRGFVYFTGEYLGKPEQYVFRVEDDGTLTRLHECTYGKCRPLVSGIGVLWLAERGALEFIDDSGGGRWAAGRGSGYSGDGGPMQQAHVSAYSIARSPAGDLYVLDGERVRRISGRPPAAAPSIASGGIVNAVSYAGGPVAPGELISIFGSNLGGPGMIVNAAENNRVPFVAWRTKVFIGGAAAAISAVKENQVNAIVPWWVEPGKAADVVVLVDTAASAPVSVPVAATAPGVAAAILNQDGSVNSRSAPAPRGSFVSLFGTGGGALTPAWYPMAVAVSPPFALLEAVVEVTIGLRRAEVSYAGVAPLHPEGVFQINVRVPEDVGAGEAAVAVSVGGVAAKQVTLFVR
jgi:uncharacterized protein (TIGR03437 family)